MGFFNFLSGVERQLNPFDNNATYKNPQGSGQNQSVGTQVKNLGVGIAKGAVSAPWWFLKNDIVVPGKEIAAELTGNKRAEQNASRSQFNGATNAGQAFRQLAGNTAQLGLSFLLPETAGAASSGLAKVGIEGVANKLATGAVAGAVTGVPYNVASTVAGTEPLTAGNLAKSAAYGAAGGAALGLGGEALGLGIHAARNAEPLNQVGAIGHDVTPEAIAQVAKASSIKEVRSALKDKLPQHVIDDIAPSILLTKDRNAITNIIDKATAPPSPGVLPGVPRTSVGNDILPAGQGTLLTPSTPGANNPIQNITDALKGQAAGPGQSPVPGWANLSAKQAELTSAGRSAQLARATGAAENLTGENALNARLSAYSGELAKADTQKLVTHVQSMIDEPTYTEALNHFLSTPSLKLFQQTNAANAWRNFYKDGKLPRAFEYKLFEKAAGADFANTIKTTAIDSLNNLQKVKYYATQSLGLPKAILASFDLSGGGRQGAFLGTRYAPQWLEGEKAAAKSFVSKDAAEQYISKIENSRYADYFDKMKLDLVSRGTFEEAFPTQLAEKIPGVGNSDRAYTVGLSTQRALTAEHILDNFQKNGFKIEQKSTLGFKHGGTLTRDLGQISDTGWESLGKYINTATGRGDLGKFLNEHATTLQAALFSPRLWKSRLDLLNPRFYAKLDGPAQKLAIQNAGTFAAVAVSILALAAAAGAKVETDARSSDFLKIKVGDTRYDILGGFQQNLVFAWRELSGEKKSSLSGKVSNLNAAGPFSSTRLSILGDLIQNKENPVISAATTQLAGKDKAGNLLTPGARAANIGNLFVPLNIQDTYKTIKNTGNIPEGLLKATIPGTFGIGVGTYGVKDIKPSKVQQAYIDKITSQGVPKAQIDATTSFYQYLKTAPDRTSATDQMKKAIQANNIDKAVQIAKDYNKKYASTFSDWAKKYGQYGNDQQLLKDYNAKEITDSTISNIIKSLQQAGGQ